MKRLAFAAILLVTPVLAQEATPPAQTADQVREDANGIIVALRQQRDAANDNLAQAMAQIAKINKQIEASKKASPLAPAPEQKDTKK